MFQTTIEQLDPISFVVVLAICLISAITDLRRFKVYNSVTIPFCLAGLVYNTLTAGLEGLEMGALGTACGAGLLFFVFIIGKAGAGDVKLLAGIGAWLGPGLVFEVFLISTISGALIALIVMLCTDSVRETGWRFVNLIFQALAPSSGGCEKGETVQEIVKRGDRARVIPFAAALFLGTSALFVLAYSLTPGTDAMREPTNRQSRRLSGESALIRVQLSRSH